MAAGKVLRLVLVIAVVTNCAMESTLFADDDVSEITWAHAVNSVRELEDALAGDINFLEADVTMGHLDGHRIGPTIPVMAHPPKHESDISLERWIDTIIARRTGKGVKLDFKVLEAVEPSLEVLQKHEKKITFPLWLNADILDGPVKTLNRPVPASDFLEVCGRLFPNTTLSLGWTTYYFPLFPIETLRYGWDHVRKMADIVRCQGLADQNVTFPVRAIFVRRSFHLLHWLLSEFEKSTLTVWSAKGDPVQVEDLLKIRESFETSRVYYDVPEPLLTTFRSKKDNHKFNTSQILVPSYKWNSFDRSSGTVACASHTYVKNNTVVFGREMSSGVLLSDVFQLSEETRLQVEGVVTFFNTEDSSEIPQSDKGHTLSLVVVDVSLFSKNRSGTLEEDNEIIWEAMNQSVLHEFKHDFQQSSTSCRYFRLDSASKEGFKAWELPCDALLDDSSLDKVLQEVGQQEKVRGSRLILPDGGVMFGMVSNGTGHVAVHRMNINGTVSAQSPNRDTNAALASKSTTLLSVLIALSLSVLLFLA